LKEQIEALRGRATADELRAVTVAYNAHVKALQALNDQATSAALRSAQDLERHCLALLAGLQAKYPAQAGPGSADPSRTPWEAFQPSGKRQDALRFLLTWGWTVSQATFYRHVQDGKLKRSRRGEITAAALKKYALNYIVRPGQVPTGETIEAAQSEDLATDKLRYEVERLRLEVEKRTIENRREDSEWLKRDEAWAAIAALLGILRDALRHYANQAQYLLVDAARGDRAAASEVYDAVETLVTNAAFNELAELKRIDVQFQRPDNDQEQDDGEHEAIEERAA